MKHLRKALFALSVSAGYAGLAFGCYALKRPFGQRLNIVLALLGTMTLLVSEKSRWPGFRVWSAIC